MTDDSQALTRADLKHMTAAEIIQAEKDGRLNELQGLPNPHTPGETLTRDDIEKLYAEGRYAEIVTAAETGHINYNEGA